MSKKTHAILQYNYDHLRASQSQKAVWSKVEKFFDDFGFSRINYSYCRKNDTDAHVKFCSWTTGWTEHYNAKQYYKHDEVVRYSIAGGHVPCNWDSSELEKYKTPKSKNILQDARDYGVLGGCSFILPPLGNAGRGFFNIVRTRDNSDSQIGRDLDGDDIGLFVGLLHSRMSELHGQYEEGAASILSQRESECLTLVSQGLITKEIAHILSCTERTVNFHLQNCMRKTGTTNRIQALRIALNRGWVTLTEVQPE
jgi:LuxR family transcriptional activator of bioluminescence operon